MSDHNFEKHIQQKLEELKISPSDTVWSSVEAQIRKEKRRRRGVIFFPILFILIGTGFYLVFQNKFSSANDRGSEIVSTNSTPGNNNNNPQKSKTDPEPVTKNHSEDNPTNSTNQPDIQNAREEQLNKTNIPENKVDRKTIDKTIPENTLSSNRETRSIKYPTRKTDILRGNANPEKKIVHKDITDERSIDGNIARTTGIEKDITNPEKKTAQDIITDQKKNDRNIAGKNQTGTPDKKKQDEGITPGDKQIVSVPDSSANKIADHAAVNRIADSTSNDLTKVRPDDTTLAATREERKTTVKKTKQLNWKWGISGSAGISNLSDGNFFDGIIGGEKALVADLAYNIAPTNAGPAAVIYKPSAIEKGFSFSLGAFVQKSISKRFSVSTALQYSFFSTHIQVGNRIDSSAMVQNAVGSLNVTQFYRSAPDRSAPVPTTHEYTNRFHFVELPVSIHTQLNKSNRLPVFWTAGLSLSYLVSTNALHFDSRTGVYYKDNELFNKLQSNLSTSFSVSLWNSSRMPFHVGPQLQYGLTNFMKHEAAASKHLFYFGLNAKVFLKK